jgi:hypothetical protein
MGDQLVRPFRDPREVAYAQLAAVAERHGDCEARRVAERLRALSRGE